MTNPMILDPPQINQHLHVFCILKISKVKTKDLCLKPCDTECSVELSIEL